MRDESRASQRIDFAFRPLRMHACMHAGLRVIRVAPWLACVL
jgi:hypothetical protein